jgi:hypothetical protein
MLAALMLAAVMLAVRVLALFVLVTRRFWRPGNPDGSAIPLKSG